MEMSPQITNLCKALTAFQAEVENPANTQENPFYKSKYAPLPEVLNLVRPILAKHGLSVVQVPSTTENGTVAVVTMLLHVSGEFIKSDPLMLKMEKNTAQGAGSVITYARRYSLAAVLGISSEDDDDGNVASTGRIEEKKDDIRKKVGKLLLELAHGDKEAAKSLLEKETEFENKDGTIVQGVKELSKLSDKRAYFVYGKLKELKKAIEEEQKGGV